MDVYMGLIFPSALGFAPKGMLYCQGQTIPIAQNSAMFALLGNVFGGDGQQTFSIPDLSGRVPVGIGSSSPDGPNLALGAKGGTTNTTLLPINVPLPPHTHPATFSATTGAAPISITVGSGGIGLTASVPALTVNGNLAISTNVGATSSPTPANRLAASATTSDGIATNIYGSPAGTNTWPVTGTTNAQAAPVNGTISGNANMVTGGTVSVGPNNASSAPSPVSLMQPYLGLAFLIAMEGLFPPRP